MRVFGVGLVHLLAWRETLIDFGIFLLVVAPLTLPTLPEAYLPLALRMIFHSFRRFVLVTYLSPCKTCPFQNGIRGRSKKVLVVFFSSIFFDFST